MSFNQNITLFAKGQQQSVDDYYDFSYFNDGTIWYEKTPTYTARVTAYAAATGITDYTILDPLNEFDKGLVYWGLDTIMKAIYPMVTDKTSQSDMANQMKYNFMNPLDTNPAFRLNWVGGWVYSRTGALPNGVNAYADTNLTPSTTLTLNSTHFSIYSRTDSATGGASGCWNTVSSGIMIDLTTSYFAIRANDSTYTSKTPIGNTSKGLFISNRISSTTKKLIQNTNISNYSINSITLSNKIIYLGAINADGTTTAYDNKQCAFASIGDGLTDFQADIFSTLVNNLQKALNRAVY